MTLPLEQTGTSDVVQRNFNRLAALVPDFGGTGVQIRTGVATVTWAGGSAFAEATVTHGLDHAPGVILVTPNSQTGTGSLAGSSNGSSSTTITVRVETCNGFTPAAATTTPVSWMVIG